MCSRKKVEIHFSTELNAIFIIEILFKFNFSISSNWCDWVAERLENTSRFYSASTLKKRKFIKLYKSSMFLNVLQSFGSYRKVLRRNHLHVFATNIFTPTSNNLLYTIKLEKYLKLISGVYEIHSTPLFHTLLKTFTSKMANLISLIRLPVTKNSNVESVFWLSIFFFQLLYWGLNGTLIEKAFS